MEVKYKKGAAPIIKLYGQNYENCCSFIKTFLGESSKPEETVGIENWNEETLNQFIEEKLEAVQLMTKNKIIQKAVQHKNA